MHASGCYRNNELFCFVVDMDMDELLADMSDDMEDSISAKPKKPAPKHQKEESGTKKQRSTEDTPPQKPLDNEGTCSQF